MARDYYPLLARAIAQLEQNTADARQAVYDHARRVLREQVRDFEPPLAATERMDEMLALENAIRKVELSRQLFGVRRRAETASVTAWL
jgi:hypothetical protein